MAMLNAIREGWLFEENSQVDDLIWFEIADTDDKGSSSRQGAFMRVGSCALEAGLNGLVT